MQTLGHITSIQRLSFCTVLVQISIKISSRRYAEEGLGTTQMCCMGAIKAEGPFCLFSFARFSSGGLN